MSVPIGLCVALLITDQAFQQMAPHTIERVRRSGKAAVKAWMGHPELQIDYINAFTRVGDLRR